MVIRLLIFLSFLLFLNLTTGSAQCPERMSIISLGTVKFTYDVAPVNAPNAFTYNGTRYSLSSMSPREFVSDNTVIELTLGGEVTIHHDASNSGCVYNVLGYLERTAPVSLSIFTGKLLDDDIELNWITDTEFDNAGFEIQRSYDGEEFMTIAIVPGAGNSETAKAYNFNDVAIKARALNNQIYYRLKQIDYDGNFAYSEIINVDLQLDFQQFEITKITGWNSHEGLIKVYLQNYADTRKIRVLLASLSGQVIEQRTLRAETGLNYLEFDLSDQQNNLFFLSINNGKTVISEKIALKRGY